MQQLCANAISAAEVCPEEGSATTMQMGTCVVDADVRGLLCHPGGGVSDGVETAARHAAAATVLPSRTAQRWRPEQEPRLHSAPDHTAAAEDRL